jgi:hypothetical protein
MKRKIYMALGLVVLCGLAVAWFGKRPPARFVGGFSTEDFKEVQKIIRQTMWQRAFPGFSAKTLATFPGSLWRLATSRIEQVNVFPGGTACVVLVRTPVGIELFDVQKSAQKPRWQIKSQGPAGEGLIKKLESIGGFAKFTVKRDIGLIGGELPAVL